MLKTTEEIYLNWILYMTYWTCFILTRGRVSTTYIYLELEFVHKILYIICSSSRHRALNPDKGWLQRQIAACKVFYLEIINFSTSFQAFRVNMHTLLECKYVKTGNLPLLLNFALPTKMLLAHILGTYKYFG